MSLFDPSKDKIRRFDSPQDYADYLTAMPDVYRCRTHDSEFAGLPHEQAIDVMVNNSDMRHVARAQAVIDQLQDQNVFSSGVPVMHQSVCGFMPLVPALIQGHPEAFLIRGRDDSQSMSAPITIYVETVVSAGITESELASRGIAVLAFAMAMQNIRPTSLYATAIGDPGYHGRARGTVVRLGSAPFNLAQVTWTLTSKEFCRRLGFSAMNECVGNNRYTGGIAWSWGGFPTKDNYIQGMREMLEMEPDDVFIPGGHLIDELMKRDPVTWVKTMIEKHTNKRD